MTYYRLIVALPLLLALAACSTRQVREDYAGSTEQRLVSHSIHQIMEQLPEKDFGLLADHLVFLECFFLEEGPLLAYARRCLEMTLMEKYRCRLTDDPADAKFTLTVFFTSLGTDYDKVGLSTPDLVLPGMGGPMSIDILALEMYHGVTEFYYYIRDPEDRVVVNGALLKKRVRNDSLLLPVISIPINTVK